VGPWIATAAAALFLLFGSGDENIIWAFQIGFVGALVLGLTQLLLADHDGPLDRRDWLGLLAGFAGLLCSGVAVTMTIVVGLAMLIRRGWRVALFHTAPLGAVYVLWWITKARDAYTTHGATIGEVARFVTTGLGATFDAMGQLPGVGVVLGAVLVVGLTLAWHGLDRAELRKRAALPGALLVAAVVFLVISGLGRSSLHLARSGRYLHLVAALSLPAVAVAADAVARRWRILAPAVLVLFLIGIPGNLHVLAGQYRQEHHVPGKMVLRLSLLQSEQHTTTANCETVFGLVLRDLDKRQSLRINGGRVRISDNANVSPFDYLFRLNELNYDPSDGHTLKATVSLKLGLEPDDPAKPVTACARTPQSRL